MTTRTPHAERPPTTSYNARIVERIDVHDDLAIWRIQPDGGPLDFIPGQYTILGVGAWEPWLGETDAEFEARRVATPADEWARLIKRPMSMSCPLLDDQGRLARPSDGPFVEFFITRVVPAHEAVPGLTPRLFRLQTGDRLFLGPRPHGHYTLDPVGPTDDVLFVATGTGEAPHNAMLAELLSRDHRGRIVSVVGARYRRDLAYEPAHRTLEARYSNYRYQPLTTREPENTDPSRPDYVGKQYVQEWFRSGNLERAAGFRLEPQRTHVFLCGGPAMVGIPARGPDGQRTYPLPPGMIEALEARGFRADEPGVSGNVHYEKFW